MMIYTSYFANMRNITEDVVFLSIARYNPKGVYIPKYDKFIPPKGILENYKHNKFYTEERYKEDYYRFILNERDPFNIYIDLEDISKGKDVVLLCYEKSENFCHRHLVREWFNDHGIKCEEYIKEN